MIVDIKVDKINQTPIYLTLNLFYQIKVVSAKVPVAKKVLIYSIFLSSLPYRDIGGKLSSQMAKPS